MNPKDLRSILSEAADQAGPHGLSSLKVIRDSRRRRRRRAAFVTGAVVAVLSAGAVAGIVLPDSWPDEEVAKSPEEPLIVCGQSFTYRGKNVTPEGVSIGFDSIVREGENSGPVIRVVVTSKRSRSLNSTPPESVRVVYLKDGIIVGGGPALNKPGDLTPQPESLVGHTIEVGPSSPSVQDLGKRDTLCPSTSWPEIWRDPAAYEVAVLMFPPVESGPEPPDLGSGHLLVREELTP